MSTGAHSAADTAVMEPTPAPTASDTPFNPSKVFVVEVAPSKIARTLGPVVIAAAVLGPLMLLPYWATRSKLRQTITELARLQSMPSTLSRLENQLVPEVREIRSGAAEAASGWAETVRRLEGENKALRHELFALGRELDKLSVRMDTESELAKIRAAQPPQREVKLVSVQEDPRIPSQLLSDVGSSLGTIASFIEEVDIKDGQPRRVDSRGIQRMRTIALKLEQLGNTTPIPPKAPFPA